jgi:hypothetical protein
MKVECDVCCTEWDGAVGEKCKLCGGTAQALQSYAASLICPKCWTEWQGNSGDKCKKVGCGGDGIVRIKGFLECAGGHTWEGTVGDKCPKCPAMGLLKVVKKKSERDVFKLGPFVEPEMVPLAKEILLKKLEDEKAGKGGLGYKRVRRVLRLYLTLHHYADEAANRLAKLLSGRDNGKEIVANFELDQLRSADPEGQDILGFQYHHRFADTPQSLAGVLKVGWELVKNQWPRMTTSDEKTKFILDVFEHDKGYLRSLNSQIAFLDPSQDMDVKGMFQAKRILL